MAKSGNERPECTENGSSSGQGPGGGAGGPGGPLLASGAAAMTMTVSQRHCCPMKFER